MKQIIKHTILLLLLAVINHTVQAQISESDVKAAFIERFTRFVEWPEEFADSTFKIAVIGKNPFNTSLEDLFNKKEVKNQKAEIIYTNNISDLTNVNLVFIAGTEKKRMKEILSAIGEKPILIISDTEGFCQMGTYINMYIDGNHIRYEINVEALEKSGLKVSSRLLASAKIVKTDD
jgi:hypothetical protein